MGMKKDILNLTSYFIIPVLLLVNLLSNVLIISNTVGGGPSFVSGVSSSGSSSNPLKLQGDQDQGGDGDEIKTLELECDINLTEKCENSNKKELNKTNSHAEADALVNVSVAIELAAQFGRNISLKECQKRFHWDRWNCSESIWLLSTGTKENAYVSALNAASVTYSIAKACARGDIDSCGCAPPTTVTIQAPGSGQHSSSSKGPGLGGYWRWGGCSADVDFAIKLARNASSSILKIVRVDNTLDKELLKAVHAHNTRMGRNLVQTALDTDCKCHGVSGSCTLKTCWMKLPTFSKIGAIVYKKYKKSKLVQVSNDNVKGEKVKVGLGSFPKKTKPIFTIVPSSIPSEEDSNGDEVELRPLRTDLIHIRQSPTYCERGPGPYAGTVGRFCLRSPEQGAPPSASCDILCCGRGYNTHVVWRRWKCSCVFHWCCVVQCQDCQERVQRYTCN